MGDRSDEEECNLSEKSYVKKNNNAKSLSFKTPVVNGRSPKEKLAVQFRSSDFSPLKRAGNDSQLRLGLMTHDYTPLRIPNATDFPTPSSRSIISQKGP